MKKLNLTLLTVTVGLVLAIGCTKTEERQKVAQTPPIVVDTLAYEPPAQPTPAGVSGDFFKNMSEAAQDSTKAIEFVSDLQYETYGVREMLYGMLKSPAANITSMIQDSLIATTPNRLKNIRLMLDWFVKEVDPKRINFDAMLEGETGTYSATGARDTFGRYGTDDLTWKFVDPRLEAKSNTWKLAFRAGRPMTEKVVELAKAARFIIDGLLMVQANLQPIPEVTAETPTQSMPVKVFKKPGTK